eukprot:4915933-Amphidinium_carterae.1
MARVAQANPALGMSVAPWHFMESRLGNGVLRTHGCSKFWDVQDTQVQQIWWCPFGTQSENQEKAAITPNERQFIVPVIGQFESGSLIGYIQNRGGGTLAQDCATVNTTGKAQQQARLRAGKHPVMRTKKAHAALD